MMYSKKNLIKAIASAFAGTALCAGGMNCASASTTMYNTYTTAAQTSTDGWVYGFKDNANGGTNSTRNIAYDPANPQALVGTHFGKTYSGFVGTSSPSATPFGYGGTSHLNWGVSLTGAGDAAQISSADALSRYGATVEVDTGGGAWRDDGSTTNGIPTGWKHQTDIGLLQSDVTQNITLNLTNLNSSFARFGITVFEGMDTKTGTYVHHGSWNNEAIPAAPSGTPPAQSAHPYNMDNPFGTVGLTNIGFSDYVDSTSAHSLTFLALAGQTYSIYLGGVDFSGWNGGLSKYQLDVNSSPVPLPGAVWLLGSALAGLRVFGRRNATLKV